jgi:hypothetical protein
MNDLTLTPLQNAQQKIRAMRAAGIAIERLDPLEKARSNPTSFRHAINAKCFDCVGRGFDANWRTEVKNCQITECGLHPVRPFKGRFQPDTGENDNDPVG